MNDLLRELAPISAEAWEQIESEARRALKVTLAARKLVDFNGPSAGTLPPSVSGAPNGSRRRRRRVSKHGAATPRRSSSCACRSSFRARRTEAVGRGAKDPNLDAVRQAARAAAHAEDRAVFHGYADAGIRGIVEAGAASSCTITEDYGAYLGVVAEATHKLRSAGVDGPYAIALGPRCFTGLNKTLIGGFPVIEHVRRLLDGPIVWAPAVDGAVVLSLRGGDFELTVGQDFSIGYLEHTATTVRLYLQESFTFRVLAPEAAVPLAYEKQ